MNASIWADDLGDLQGPIQPVPAEADAVIVGAGYTGLNAARELARSGWRVVVLDQGSVGDGASGVNFGSAALGVAAPWKDLSARYGDAVARSWAALSVRALADLCALIDREGIDCQLRRSGHITIALDRGQMARLERTKGRWDGFADPGLVLLPAAAAREHLDIAAIRGALLNPQSYTLNPAKYLAGLFRAAVRAGVTVVQRTRVEGIRRLGPELFETRCGAALLRSRHAIVCTDGTRMPGFRPSRRGIVTIHSYMIATAPLTDEELRPISAHPFATARTMPDYFRRTVDNRLLFGSRRNLAPPSPAGDAAELAARMRALLPFTAGFPVTHSWSGPMGFTLDRLPHVGVADGIHYALGYCGKGIPWSAYCGRAVADLVKGGEPEGVVATPLIQPRLDRGHPWFLRALSWYYRTRDVFRGFTP